MILTIQIGDDLSVIIPSRVYIGVYITPEAAIGYVADPRSLNFLTNAPSQAHAFKNTEFDVGLAVSAIQEANPDCVIKLIKS